MARLRAFQVRDGVFAMLHDGEYDLSAKAKSILWFLLYHGIWEPGHQWFGFADIKMTSNSVIQVATGWSEDSVRRGLRELEDREFIRRGPRYHPGGIRANDSIQLTYPDDWCGQCHKRGNHVCGDDTELRGS